MDTHSSQSARRYEDFDLHLWQDESDDADTYRVLGPVGGTTVFGLMKNADYARVKLRERDFWDYPDAGKGGIVGELMKRPSAVEREDLVGLGDNLAKLALPEGEVRDLFLKAYQMVVRDRNDGLRLRLRIDPAVIARLPFEYLRLDEVESQGGFLGLHTRISIVRSHLLEAPPYRARESRSRVHFVGVLSAAENGSRPIKTASDFEAVSAALSGLKGSTSGAVRPRFFGAGEDRAEWDRVSSSLLGGADIVHFTGHGDFGSDGYGSLVFETDMGGEAPVLATNFATAVGASGARLALLGACESGRVGPTNPWNGIARALIKEAMPAVIANQFPVHQHTARLVASEVYGRVLSHATADEAVSFARARIASERSLGADWGVPVLYLDNGDGVLFPPDANDQLAGSLRRISQADPNEVQARSLNHSPFPGVKPYSAERAAWFFGRDDGTQQLLTLLGEGERFATLLGAAGTGKTSLLAAGVAARWDGPVVHIDEYADLDAAARSSFAAAGLRNRSTATLIELAREQERDNLLLVFDQMERILDLDHIGQDAVRAALSPLFADRPDGVAVVFSVREENSAKSEVIRRDVGAPDLPVRISRLTRAEAAAALGGGLRSLIQGDVDEVIIDHVVAELDDLRYDEDDRIEPTELQIVAQSIVKSMRDRADASQEKLALSMELVEPSADVIAAYLDNQLRTYFAADEDRARTLLERFSSAREGVWLAPEDLGPGHATSELQITLGRLVRSGFLVQRRRERSEFAFSRPAVSQIVDRWVSPEALQAKRGHSVLDGAMAEWKYKARTIPSETLRRLEPVAPLLDPRPDEALLLTRSAVVNNESAAPWFRHVHSKAAETVAELDGGSSLSSIDGRLLGLAPDGPAESGSLATTAVSASSQVDRRMAVLALAATPDFTPKLEQAVQNTELGSFKRSMRSAELWATVTDAEAAEHPPGASVAHRMLVWWHRAWRRIKRDAYPIGRDAIRAGVVAGLLVGLVRAVFCWIECTDNSPAQEWATALGLNTVFTLLVVSVTVAAIGCVTAIANIARIRSHLAGVITFGLMMWAVAWTNGIPVSEWPLTVVLGFPAGIAAVLAVTGRWNLGAVRLALVGAVLWAMIQVALTFTAGWTCSFPNCERSAALPVGRSANFHADGPAQWHDVVTSVLDAALVGAAIAAGTALGVRAPEQELVEEQPEEVGV